MATPFSIWVNKIQYTYCIPFYSPVFIAIIIVVSAEIEHRN